VISALKNPYCKVLIRLHKNLSQKGLQDFIAASQSDMYQHLLEEVLASDVFIAIRTRWFGQVSSSLLIFQRQLVKPRHSKLSELRDIDPLNVAKKQQLFLAT
jgi:multimeric flavodoxin WrbA